MTHYLLMNVYEHYDGADLFGLDIYFDKVVSLTAYQQVFQNLLQDVHWNFSQDLQEIVLRYDEGVWFGSSDLGSDHPQYDDLQSSQVDIGDLSVLEDVRAGCLSELFVASVPNDMDFLPTQEREFELTRIHLTPGGIYWSVIHHDIRITTTLITWPTLGHIKDHLKEQRKVKR